VAPGWSWISQDYARDRGSYARETLVAYVSAPYDPRRLHELRVACRRTGAAQSVQPVGGSANRTRTARATEAFPVGALQQPASFEDERAVSSLASRRSPTSGAYRRRRVCCWNRARRTIADSTAELRAVHPEHVAQQPEQRRPRVAVVHLHVRVVYGQLHESPDLRGIRIARSFAEKVVRRPYQILVISAEPGGCHRPGRCCRVQAVADSRLRLAVGSSWRGNGPLLRSSSVGSVLTGARRSDELRNVGART
jgi:hypothetical protein